MTLHSNCDKTQKKSNCEKLKKTQTVTKLKKIVYEKLKNLNYNKIEIVRKIKNSNCDKTQQIKFLQQQQN